MYFIFHYPLWLFKSQSGSVLNVLTRIFKGHRPIIISATEYQDCFRFGMGGGVKMAEE